MSTRWIVQASFILYLLVRTRLGANLLGVISCVPPFRHVDPFFLKFPSIQGSLGRPLFSSFFSGYFIAALPDPPCSFVSRFAREFSLG